jgi:predicted alpha/beta-hydrolase family hydrolase
MAYPLHPQGKPEKMNPEQLFRIISPVLFLQGSRDRTCELDLLRQTLTRVGAPTSLFVSQDADRHFKVPKKIGRPQEEVSTELAATLDEWIQKVLEGGG